MKTYKFPVVIEKDEEGFFVDCPAIQGCHSHGDTYKEAMANIKEAIEVCLEDMEAHGEEIPNVKTASLPIVEVSV